MLISILIPAFNQPQYIQQAVKSALDQDYGQLEVIVCDDSTDQKTMDNIQPFLSDSRFVYHKNKKRLGRVANYRKLLFELAKGEWVLMLDGDDYLTDPKYISKAVRLIRQNESLVLVGAGTKVLNESSGEQTSSGLGDSNLIFDGKEIFSKFQGLPNHQTDIYNRRIACELDFYRDPSTASDSESLYRLCLRGKVAYLAETAAVWRVHDSNTTYSRKINTQVKELVFIDNVYDEAVNYLDKKTADRWRTHMYKSMSLHLLGMSFSTRNYIQVVKIILRFGKFLGWKLSASYLLQIVGFSRQPSSPSTQ